MSDHTLDRRAFLGGAAAGTVMTAVPFHPVFAASESVKIAYGSDGYTGSVPYVADGIEAWKKHGLSISTGTFPSGRESLESALTRDSDFGTTTDSPYLFAALRGLKPVVFANYSRYSKDMKIVMRTGRGAKEDDPTSIKGKRIATRIGTSGHYALQRYLEMAKLKKSDITIVNMTPADGINALVRGDVDGLSWTSRAASVVQNALKDDSFVMTQDGFEKYFASHQLMCSNDKVLAERPGVLKAGVQAMLDAEAFMLKDKSWLDIVAKRTKTTTEAATKETADFEFQLRFDDRFVEDLIAAAEWAIEEKLAKRPDGDLRKIFVDTFYTKALAEVAPDRVSVKV
jgi:ABC-type nitrate/sulfonate/bicarbonate transport system substrate-binding protein